MTNSSTRTTVMVREISRLRSGNAEPQRRGCRSCRGCHNCRGCRSCRGCR